MGVTCGPQPGTEAAVGVHSPPTWSVLARVLRVSPLDPAASRGVSSWLRTRRDVKFRALLFKEF